MIGVPRASSHEATGGEALGPRWRRNGLLFVLATLLLFTLFHEAPLSMARIWMSSDTFGYGFLILPIVLYLTWQRRGRLAAVMPRPCFWALPWIAAWLLVDVVGGIANVMLLRQLAFVALWEGLLLLLLGWAVVRQMLFPLFFLFFAVPMGEQVIPFLQTITAEIAVFLLRASGIPTFHSGILIEIPSASFVVADVCSGARFLITTVVLGTLAANVFFKSWRRRIGFMALCLVVPILANGVRAYGTVMLAHHVDLSFAVSVDHIVYGLIFLSIVLVILTALGALFADRKSGDEPPLPRVDKRSAQRLLPSLLAFAVAGLLLAGGKAWSVQLAQPPAASGTETLAALRPDAAWAPAEERLAYWEPAFSGADFRRQQAFQRAGSEASEDPDASGAAVRDEVALFIAHYHYQRDGHEIIATRNSFVGRGRDRGVTRFEVLPVDLGSERFEVRETLVNYDDGPHLLWSWYDIGGQRTTSPLTGKVLEIWHNLSGGARSATAFALLTPAGEELAVDRARLQAFLRSLEPREHPAVSDAAAGS